MRLPKVLAAGLLLTGLAGPVGAKDLSINLTASVSTRCVVTGVEADVATEGRLRVFASCNASAFQVVLGGDLANLPIQSASGTNARLSVHGNTVAVRPERPGDFAFEVQYNGSLATVRAASADIRTY